MGEEYTADTKQAVLGLERLWKIQYLNEIIK